MVNTKPNKTSFKKGNSPWNKGKRKQVDLDFIKNLYRTGYSTIELGKKFNVSDKTISSRLRDIGVKVRKNTEHSDRTKDKIKQTLIKKGIQPIERYCGVPWNKGKTGVQTAWNKNKQPGQKNWVNRKFTEETIRKIKEARAKQIFPVKDTTIEVKIQEYLKRLNIEFYTHQYISEIEHAYQCDILIPVQRGINKKTIIECFGDYWHEYPLSRKIDNQRCKELRAKGWRVLVFWESEIRNLPIEVLDSKIR